MRQMTLSLEAGLSARYRSLVECVAAGVYQRGLGRIAAQVDVAPSHLSNQLSGGDGRKLAAETLELYIEKTGDLTPIHYLIDKFMRDPAAQQQEALAQLAKFAEALPALMQAAGLQQSKARRG